MNAGPSITAGIAAAGAWLHASLRQTLDLCYPRCCEGCGGTVDPLDGHLCWDCLAQARYVTDPMCACCGDPVDGAVEHTFECGWCRRTRPAFDAARSAVRYRGPLKAVLQHYKYRHAVHLAADLGALLEGCVQAYFAGRRFDEMTCVPLHSRKARERGYNQARLLAEALGRRLRLPVTRHALERVRCTATQTRLNAEARKANVRDAFRTSMPDWIAGRRWLLVDDVMTTGATVHECARVLKQAGAVSVHVVTVARG